MVCIEFKILLSADECFQVMEKNVAPLALNRFSKPIALRGYKARETLVKEFYSYFQSHYFEKDSPLVKARWEAQKKHELSFEDMARFETSLFIALFANTGLAAFWALFYVLSNKNLFADLQGQLDHFVGSSLTESNHLEMDSSRQRSIHIDMRMILNDCPLLSSLLREVLYMESTNAAGRMVVEDTMLNN